MSIEPKTFDMLEQTTGQYTATLVGNDGVTPIPGTSVSTLTLTLYVVLADGTITKLRDNQNVLNANNVTVSAAGLVTWLIQTADTTLQEAIPFERHIALFRWTWATGAGYHEAVLVIKNLDVP